jgi:hypothetical protein
LSIIGPLYNAAATGFNDDPRTVEIIAPVVNILMHMMPVAHSDLQQNVCQIIRSFLKIRRRPFFK